MISSDRKFVRMLKYLALVGAVCMVSAAVAPPALAQGTICNSDLTINFPNGNNINRTIGSTIRMSLTIENGQSLEAGVDDNQVFMLIDFFPSCLNVVGNVCTVDPGFGAGAPPPIAYAGNLTNVNCPVAPTVDTSNPFNIKFNLVPPYDFDNNVGCTFSFDVTVTEAGSNGTPAAIEQLASTSGVCGSGLTSSDTGTAAITLACPDCDDGNQCNGPEVCNQTTLTCDPGTPLVCNDSNACTVDSCIPASGCSFVNRPPDFCDDDNACTDDLCVPATGCTNTQKPPDFCDDSNECTVDICVPATGCSNTQQPPDFCDDDNECTTDICDPATGCENTQVPPDFCDDDSTCTADICDPEEGCVNTPLPPDQMPPECLGSCRMTGGHNWDVVDAEFNENGKVYTTGGQIGAPNETGCCDFPPKGKCVEGTCTGGKNAGDACSSNEDCPNDPGRNSSCPWGDWEHNHHSGPDDSGSVDEGSFAFHSGTAAAPNEAFISSVLCADPGWCVQARPAPFKQIFWEGTGVFHNIKGAKGKPIPLAIFDNCPVQPVPWSNKTDGTLHYYKAHVSDFGEPAGIHQKPIDGCQKADTCINPEPNGSVEINDCTLGEVCLIEAETDPVKTALHPLCLAQTCSECPDEYEIEIHCTADPASPIAYVVSHEIRQGNFQLHPPVGDSCNPSCGDGVCETGATGTAETCATCSIDCCD